MRKATCRICLIPALCLTLVCLFALAGCGGDSSINGVYSVEKESIYLGGGGNGEGYDEETSNMSVTIEGVEESEGKSGTILLQRNADQFTGTLENDLSKDDEAEFHYKVTWDNDRAPQETENPYGNDKAGSFNDESTNFKKDMEGVITLQVIWSYGNAHEKDVYQGTDTYTLQK